MSKDWLPPEPPRGSPGWLVASLAVHAVAALVLVIISGRREPRGASYIPEPGGGGRVIVIDLPYVPAGGGARGEAGGTGTTRPPVAAAPSAGVGTPHEGGAGAPPAGEPPAATGTGAAGRRILGPRLGDGRVWVRPLDALAAAIAGLGRGEADTAAHIARIDSAVAARITAFLDTLRPDSMATARAKPWVTEIAGEKWGIDGSWIYLGGLKLPSAILALLPLPQGNYEQAQRAAELQRIREDILQAGRRAESAAEFKKYVEETRKRRDAERQAKKHQKIPPDSIRT
jgi:hypothetical protein